ncbi:hypothetical protein GCM10025776_08140 [Corallincola platygyrae]
MKLAVLYFVFGFFFSILTFIFGYEDVSCFGCKSRYIFNPISIVFALIGFAFLVISFRRAYLGANLVKNNEYNAKDIANDSDNSGG